MTTLATFWAGRLGPLEMASLHSFARQGQGVAIYSYRPLDGLPDGVANLDAAEVLPSERVTVYAREGSPALHANFFRYALMSRTPHLWVDLDMVALRPFRFDGPHVFGLESPGRVNNAVLRLPATSPALQDLLRYRPGHRGVGPQIRGFRRVRHWVKTLGRGTPVERWPWGSTGPVALTHHLAQSGELRHALPVEAFYPVAPGEHERLLRPGALDVTSFGAGSYGVHLWAKELRRTLAERCGGVPPDGSFVAQAVAAAARDGFRAGSSV